MDKIQEILTFWFENVSDQTPISNSHPAVKKWFTKDLEFDCEIKTKFENDFIKAERGDYHDWETTPTGRLAVVILFDQFSRNMYRGTPKMFAADSLALRLSLKSIEDKRDQELQLIERLFLYMPLMHAEDLKVQKNSVEQFENLVKESQVKSSQNTGYYKFTLGYAQKYYDIIKRFGRFSHRNEILNRTSTKEELDFLTPAASRF